VFVRSGSRENTEKIGDGDGDGDGDGRGFWYEGNLGGQAKVERKGSLRFREV